MKYNICLIIEKEGRKTVGATGLFKNVVELGKATLDAMKEDEEKDCYF